MSNNRYYIKYTAMDQFYSEMCVRASDWNSQLNTWKATYQILTNMDSFSGNSADAVKAYFGEVHEVLIGAICTAITRYQSDFLLYKKNYYNIEGNIYASISQDTIKSVESRLSDEIRYLSNIHSEIQRKLDSVKDIYWNGRPTNIPLENHMKS